MPPIPVLLACAVFAVLLACAVFAVIYTAAVVLIGACISTPDDDELLAEREQL